MENNLKNIDKHIYTVSSDIKKSYKHLTWAFICILLGAIALWLYVSYESIAQHEVWSGLMLMIIFAGVFSLVTLICYYIFGDCYSPYYKPTKEWLNREEVYFSSSNIDKIKQSIDEKNISALSNFPKSIVPQVVVVKYSNDKESVMAIQAFDNADGVMQPVTNIVVCSK